MRDAADSEEFEDMSEDYEEASDASYEYEEGSDDDACHMDAAHGDAGPSSSAGPGWSVLNQGMASTGLSKGGVDRVTQFVSLVASGMRSCAARTHSLSSHALASPNCTPLCMPAVYCLADAIVKLQVRWRPVGAESRRQQSCHPGQRHPFPVPNPRQTCITA